MPDNLNKRIADGKRISLGQDHEVDYLKKIAKEQHHILKHGGKHSGPQLQRICKGLLKCLDRIDKLEKKIERTKNDR